MHPGSLAPASTIARMQRERLLAELARPIRHDLAIVGGGATGLGLALDAAARGFSVVLLESHDFASGTSSRATKLVHGGVRYLAQGQLGLVREALRERRLLLANAPHLTRALPFLMPAYRRWEVPFYGTGLKLYDALAGAAGLGPTEWLGAGRTRALLAGVQPDGLRGGVRYWDGQFDDAGLALALARSAAGRGALLVNYCEVTGLVHEAGQVAGVRARCTESGQAFRVTARCVVNATGVWVDALRQHDAQALGRPVGAMVAPSQGVHAVVDARFLPGDHALIVPRTADGRVLFAVPWMGKLVLGTTDTPRADLPREPRALREELDFILREAGRYLAVAPQEEDIRSLWVGLRPLVRPPDEPGQATAALSREHTVLVSRSGLVTVTGGKWTTYRAMAEDVLERCFVAGLLPRGPAGVTRELRLAGAQAGPWQPAAAAVAPDDAAIEAAVHGGYVRTVEDLLARRSRLLFLDAAQALAAAPRAAREITRHTGADPQLSRFEALARSYLQLP